jgi:hypothetical protein
MHVVCMSDTLSDVIICVSFLLLPSHYYSSLRLFRAKFNVVDRRSYFYSRASETTMSAARNMSAMRLISRNSQRAVLRTRNCAPANLATRSNFFLPSASTRFEQGISSRLAPVAVRHMSSSTQPDEFVKNEIESNKVRPNCIQGDVC